MGNEMTRRSLVGSVLAIGAGVVACSDPVAKRSSALVAQLDQLGRRQVSAVGRATGLKATACRECKNLISEGPIWYSNFCGASPVPQRFDPVTGQMSRPDGNRRFEHVRSVNDGNCRLFKAKAETEI